MGATSYIRLDRNILSWEHYSDPVACHVFIHILLTVRHTDSNFMGHDVHRGQLITTYSELSKELGLSKKQIENNLRKLRRSGEIETDRLGNFTMITVNNYNVYQADAVPQKQEKAEKQKKQSAKPEKKETIPPRYDEEYCSKHSPPEPFDSWDRYYRWRNQ